MTVLVKKRHRLVCWHANQSAPSLPPHHHIIFAQGYDEEYNGCDMGEGGRGEGGYVVKGVPDFSSRSHDLQTLPVGYRHL